MKKVTALLFCLSFLLPLCSVSASDNIVVIDISSLDMYTNEIVYNDLKDRIMNANNTTPNAPLIIHIAGEGRLEISRWSYWHDEILSAFHIKSGQHIKIVGITDNACIAKNLLSGSIGALFTIEENGSLELENIRIEGTSISQDSLIRNRGELIIQQNVILQGNCSDTSGGAIYNEGKVTMYGGEITNNETMMYDKDRSVVHEQGEVVVYPAETGGGGGVYNSGEFIMKGGTITNNRSFQYGGGIYNSGKLIIEGGDISSNYTDRDVVLKSQYNRVNAGDQIYNDGGEVFMYTGISIPFTGTDRATTSYAFLISGLCIFLFAFIKNYEITLSRKRIRLFCRGYSGMRLSAHTKRTATCPPSRTRACK